MGVTLYVGNLPWKLSEDELAEAFSTCSKVESVRIITDRETGRSRGFGFVEVPAADAARAAQIMNGFELKGRKLIVNEARPKTLPAQD
jgi:RNA recognition motif-containing protein